jgi:hypothetical protein
MIGSREDPLETLRREREEIERQYAALRQENENLRKLIESDDYYERKKTYASAQSNSERDEEEDQEEEEEVWRNDRECRSQRSRKPSENSFKQKKNFSDEIDEEFYLDNDSSEETHSERSPPQLNQPRQRLDSDMDDSNRQEASSGARRRSIPKLDLASQSNRPISASFGPPPSERERILVGPPRPSSAIINLPPASYLFDQRAEQAPDLTSLPHLLWKGGILWKIPFNGRGLPERRLIMIKRVTRPTAKSKPVRILGPDLLFAAPETSTPRTGSGVGYISFPPTIIWANPEKPDDLSNARELSLGVGTHIVEGHQSPAFWKSQSRGDPLLPSPLISLIPLPSLR